MGGRPKGMLVAPGGGTLIDHWLAVLHAAGICQVLLVGRHEAYGALSLERIHDAPSGIGPIRWKLALRRAPPAIGRLARALALACDMPLCLPGPDRAPARGTRRARRGPATRGCVEPLCCRYDAHADTCPSRCAGSAAGRHSLQPLLAEAGAVELRSTPADRTELHDWGLPLPICFRATLASAWGSTQISATSFKRFLQIRGGPLRVIAQSAPTLCGLLLFRSLGTGLRRSKSALRPLSSTHCVDPLNQA